MRRIVLASGSPRRRQLLEWAEIPFDLIVSNTEESFPEGTQPPDAAIMVAEKKANAVSRMPAYIEMSDCPPILAADTMVVLEGQIIGKPTDRSDAVSILQLLSGKRHQVITGVTILSNEKKIQFSDTTDVWFNEISLSGIEHYVDAYAPYDKAGAYAIQEWIGVVGLHKIHGDFYNVMGLPINRVFAHLQEL